MNNIPLQHAQLTWDTGSAVVQDYRAGVDRYPHLTSSRGACGEGWAGLSTTQRMERLLDGAFWAVKHDQIAAEAMHEALSIIPEYRACFAAFPRPFLLFSTLTEDDWEAVRSAFESYDQPHDIAVELHCHADACAIDRNLADTIGDVHGWPRAPR